MRDSLPLNRPGTDGTFDTGDDGYSAVSTVGNPYTFTARSLDSETGLMYYRARYYATGQGRFIGRDPEGYVDGMNLYAYAISKPLRFVDPLGTQACKDQDLPPWLKKWVEQLKERIKRLPPALQERALKAVEHFAGQRQPWEQQLGLRLLGMLVEGTNRGILDPLGFTGSVNECEDIVNKVSALMVFNDKDCKKDCHGWADSFRSIINPAGYFTGEKVWRMNPDTENGSYWFHVALAIYPKGMEGHKGGAPVIDHAARLKANKVQQAGAWISDSGLGLRGPWGGFGEHPLAFEVPFKPNLAEFVRNVTPNRGPVYGW